MPRQFRTAEIQELRDNILAAASALFAEHGANGVTMRALAQELGVSTMAPYHYYRDKNEMMAALQARACSRFTDAVEAMNSQTENPCDRFYLRRAAYIRFALDEPVNYRLIFEYLHPDQRAYPELVRADARARQLMSKNFIALVDQGYMKGDPVTIGCINWTAMHGILILKIDGKISPKIDARKMLDTARDCLVLRFATKKWWSWAQKNRLPVPKL